MMIFSRNCLLTIVLTVVLFVNVESVQILINGQPVLVDQSLNIDLGSNATLFNITNSTDKIGSLVRFMININMFTNRNIQITNNVDNRNAQNVKNNLNNNVIVNSNDTSVNNNNNNAGGGDGGGIFNNNNNFVVNGANSTNDTSIDVVVNNNNNNGDIGGGGDDYYGDYYDDDYYYYDDYYDSYPYVDTHGRHPTSSFKHASRFKTPFNYGPGGTPGGLRGNPFGKLINRDRIKKPSPTTRRTTTTTTTTTRRPGRKPRPHRPSGSSNTFGGNGGSLFRDRFNIRDPLPSFGNRLSNSFGGKK